MSKKFISVMPFQPKLTPIIYNPIGNSMEYNAQTPFPAIPLIYNNAEEGERVNIFTIIPNNERSKGYYKDYCDEVNKIALEKGFTPEFNSIEIPDIETKSAHTELFTAFINAFDSNETLYADITYGTKPTPMVLFAALNYANKIKEDVEIGCISYGRYPHDGGSIGSLYDITSLFYLNSTVEHVANMDVPDPEKVIRTLLEL